jgi:hypothetical protein
MGGASKDLFRATKTRAVQIMRPVFGRAARPAFLGVPEGARYDDFRWILASGPRAGNHREPCALGDVDQAGPRSAYGASDFESGGQGFESLPARQLTHGDIEIIRRQLFQVLSCRRPYSYQLATTVVYRMSPGQPVKGSAGNRHASSLVPCTAWPNATWENQPTEL